MLTSLATSGERLPLCGQLRHLERGSLPVLHLVVAMRQHVTVSCKETSSGGRSWLSESGPGCFLCGFRDR
jgi:hypothetical protein